MAQVLKQLAPGWVGRVSKQSYVNAIKTGMMSFFLMFSQF